MIYRRDKRGLFVKSGSDEEDSDSRESDNPVFKALDTIKIRHQISTESTESQQNSKGFYAKNPRLIAYLYKNNLLLNFSFNRKSSSKSKSIQT